LWIDAICIDQSNTAEKNVQVGMMGQIYSLAERVVVFFNLSDRTARELYKLHTRLSDIMQSLQSEDWITFCDQIDRRDDDWSSISAAMQERILDERQCSTPIWKIVCSKLYEQLGWKELDYSTRWQVILEPELAIDWNSPELKSQGWHSYRSLACGLFDIASANYWLRAWILQELVLARDVQLMSPCGAFSVDMILCFVLHWVHQELLAAANDEDGSRPMLFDRLVYLAQNLDPFILRLSPKHPKACPIPKELDCHFPGQLEALEVTKRLGCQDLRDRVYSVLSLLPSGKHFKINYGCKFDQLLWQVLNFEAQLSASVYSNVQSTKEADHASTNAEASKDSASPWRISPAQAVMHKLIDADILGHAVDMFGMTKPTNCRIVHPIQVPRELMQKSSEEVLAWAMLDYDREEYQLQDVIYGQFDVSDEKLLFIWPVVLDERASRLRANGYLASVWHLSTSGWQHIRSFDNSFRTQRERASEVDCPCCICNVVQPRNGFDYWPWYPRVSGR